MKGKCDFMPTGLKLEPEQSPECLSAAQLCAVEL